MDILAAWLQIGAVLLLVYNDSLTVPRLFATMGGASAIVCAGWFAVRPETLRIARGRLWDDWRANWQFGRWSLSSHLIGSAMTYVLPWLLAAAHDEAATGTLAASSKLSALAGTFVIGVTHFLTPKAVAAFMANGLPGLQRVLGAAVGVFMVTVGGFCLVVLAAGDQLMAALFGGDFAGTGSIAVVLSLGVLVNSISIVAGNGLWAINRPRANLIGDLATLLVTLSVAVWLVAALGALGIAAAILGGGVAGAIVRALTFHLLSRQFVQQKAVD